VTLEIPSNHALQKRKHLADILDVNENGENARHRLHGDAYHGKDLSSTLSLKRSLIIATTAPAVADSEGPEI
jgi:hypothetical protein